MRTLSEILVLVILQYESEPSCGGLQSGLCWTVCEEPSAYVASHEWQEDGLSQTSVSNGCGRREIIDGQLNQFLGKTDHIGRRDEIACANKTMH